MSTYRLPGGGNKVKKAKKEAEIIHFMIRCKEIGIRVSTKLIIQEYCRICPGVEKNSKSTLKKWCYRFLKRNNYTINDFKTSKK